VGLPISILLNPSSLSTPDLHELKKKGAQMAAVALDLATEDLFERHRGSGVGGPHRFDQYWSMLRATANTFGQDKPAAT